MPSGSPRRWRLSIPVHRGADPTRVAEDLAYVAGRTTTPIAAGERLTSVYEVRPFLRDRSLAILQCDIVNCGGFTGAKKIAAMAEAHFVHPRAAQPNGPIRDARLGPPDVGDPERPAP